MMKKWWSRKRTQWRKRRTRRLLGCADVGHNIYNEIFGYKLGSIFS
jgi:hypothetical protein